MPRRPGRDGSHPRDDRSSRPVRDRAPRRTLPRPTSRTMPPHLEADPADVLASLSPASQSASSRDGPADRTRRVADCCTDAVAPRTPPVAASAADRGVLLRRLPHRRGQSSAGSARRLLTPPSRRRPGPRRPLHEHGTRAAAQRASARLPLPAHGGTWLVHRATVRRRQPCVRGCQAQRPQTGPRRRRSPPARRRRRLASRSPDGRPALTAHTREAPPVRSRTGGAPCPTGQERTASQPRDSDRPMTAGPTTMMSSAGRMQTMSGKVTLTGTFIAASSARWRRLTRISSACTRRTSEIDTP